MALEKAIDILKIADAKKDVLSDLMHSIWKV